MPSRGPPDFKSAAGVGGGRAALRRSEALQMALAICIGSAMEDAASSSGGRGVVQIRASVILQRPKTLKITPIRNVHAQEGALWIAECGCEAPCRPPPPRPASDRSKPWIVSLMCVFFSVLLINAKPSFELHYYLFILIKLTTSQAVGPRGGQSNRRGRDPSPE